MAHECPECYSLCYCGGDIDDCLLNIEADVNRCEHCPVDGLEDDEDRDYADGEDDDCCPDPDSPAA